MKPVELSNIKYIVENDTFYHEETGEKLIALLEKLRAEKTRIIIHYGDPKTGRPWGDKESGYIGRSTGSMKIPLIVYNSRSLGGGGLLDNCIIRIETSKGKRVLYESINS